MKINFDKYHIAISFLLATIAAKKPTIVSLDEVVSDSCGKYLEFFIADAQLPLELRSPDVRAAFERYLQQRYAEEHTVRIVPGKIFGHQGHKPWLQAEVKAGRISMDGFKRYCNRLQEENGFNDASIKAIDESTDKVLDYMGNPRADHGYQTFGLLMGDVQSGKTATFTGICHKAIAAGYRFIIVLTGTKSSLRNQTQGRLDSDLTGTSMDSSGRQQKKFHQRGIDWNKLTTVEQDFNSKRLDSQIAPDNPKQVTIAVTQKNSIILGNLLEWMTRVESLGIRNLPLLLIDDEADAASINVNKPEEDPTKINEKIRRILRNFDKAAYLAVTATPFANVFIDPQVDEAGEIRQGELPDLFPRDFIYVLPPPKGYLGVERLFGDYGEIEEDSLKYRSLIPMTLSEDCDGDESKFYDGNFKANEEIYELSPSLKRAVLYFLCVCTLKDLDLNQSNTSMLVHVARYKKVQSSLKDRISELISRVKALADTEQYRITPELLANPLFAELEELWNEGCGNEKWYEDPIHGRRPPTLKELSATKARPEGFEWQDIWKKSFKTALKKVQVVEANTNAQVKNFAAYYEKHDAKLIVVGGDALSRGLTLEGLCVSYFSRRSFAYDTLLQMGRWFGYREGMKNYMKIWISDCLVDAYGYVAEAVGEFRETLETMRNQNRNPSDFGLRIRCAPKAVKLMVTAANKRRSARKIRVMVDITGRPFQASTMPRSPEEQAKNVGIVSDFLKTLGAPRRDAVKNQDLVWEGISSDRIAELLIKFKVPRWSNDLEIAPFAEKIRERGDEWIVRVLSLKRENREFEDVFGLGKECEVGCLERTFIQKAGWVEPLKRAVLSPSDFARDWDAQKKKAVEDECGGVLMPGMVLRRADEKPQLMVYPLRTNTEKKTVAGDLFVSEAPLVALVFGIPGSGADTDNVSVDYDTNRIYQMQREDGYYEEDGEE